MKTLWLTLLLLWTFVMVEADILETIDFDYDRLIINETNLTVAYAGLESISDDESPSVPFLTRIFASDDDGECDLRCQIISADTIDLGFEPRLNQKDIVTSDQNLGLRKPAVLRGSSEKYPEKACIKSVCRIDGRTMVTLSIFPVQFLNQDKLILNRQIVVGGDSKYADNPATTFRFDILAKSDRPQPVPSAPTVSCPLGTQLVVITSSQLRESFEGLVSLKIRTGQSAAIAVTDSICAAYAGLDDAEKIRNYLDEFYSSGGKFVIMGGDENHVPVRYAYFYNTSSPVTLDHQMICDLYFADLDGDWDYDGDGVFGEPTEDHPDLGAELLVGRLPFSTPAQVLSYTSKLEQYLFHPGGRDYTYLNRAAFFTSDQMRDYFEGGQQYKVAEKFPDGFLTDCETLAEAPDGIDPAPTGPTPELTISTMAGGFGMVNILAHGRPDGFILNSSAYNLYPKHYLMTGSGDYGHTPLQNLSSGGKTGFYYSISCVQGAIDLESVYGMEARPVVEELLSLDSTGAIGMIAFSRWGWVASSYKLMASFYDHLFNDAQGNPAAAMQLSYLDYPYYRDQIYGQNLYGDPSLTIYTGLPSLVFIDMPSDYVAGKTATGRLTLDGLPLANQNVTIITGDHFSGIVVTDADGVFEIAIEEDCVDEITLTAYVPGCIAAEKKLLPGIAADADDDAGPVASDFSLHQNFPNPFNPSTTIGFSLSRSCNASLEIYNIAGQLVNEIANDFLAAGDHEITWNGTNSEGRQVASGIYIYRLASADGILTKKMCLVR